MRELTFDELLHVSGGTVVCPPEPCEPYPPCEPKPECPPAKTKGNNGWGNGGDDGTNGGSSKGNTAQADSKAADDDR
jgi:hypothetical protein